MISYQFKTRQALFQKIIQKLLIFANSEIHLAERWPLELLIETMWLSQPDSFKFASFARSDQ